VSSTPRTTNVLLPNQCATWAASAEARCCQALPTGSLSHFVLASFQKTCAGKTAMPASASDIAAAQLAAAMSAARSTSIGGVRA